MNLCDDNHDEVCFTIGTCPVCAVRSELRIELATAIKEYNDLEANFEELELDLAEHWSQNIKFRDILAEIAPEHLL